MSLSRFAATALALALAGAAVAAPQVGKTPSDCPPPKAKTHTERSYRAPDDCEQRWRLLLARHATAGQTHDAFIAQCKKECFVPLAALPALTEGGSLLGALPEAGIAGLGAVGSGGSAGGAPASP